MINCFNFINVRLWWKWDQVPLWVGPNGPFRTGAEQPWGRAACTPGKMASSDMESWYISLLGLSETFRTWHPPNLKLCIHCLQSIFNFNPPPVIESRTHLQLGTILLYHTKNQDLARSHLEKAVSEIISFDAS